MAPSRPSETTAGACTRMPTSIAYAFCTVRWRTDTASAGSRRSPTRNCTTWPASTRRNKNCARSFAISRRTSNYGRRTRGRTLRLDHRPAGTHLRRLHRVPTGTRPPRRTHRVMSIRPARRLASLPGFLQSAPSCWHSSPPPRPRRTPPAWAPSGASWWTRPVDRQRACACAPSTPPLAPPATPAACFASASCARERIGWRFCPSKACPSSATRWTFVPGWTAP